MYCIWPSIRLHLINNHDAFSRSTLQAVVVCLHLGVECLCVVCGLYAVVYFMQSVQTKSFSARGGGGTARKYI
jgi:hypothetical protein